MATTLFVLYEHATGYAVFRTCEFEEVAMFLPQVESSVSDLSKFNSIIKLVAFSPFKSGTNALDNINSISEGLLHEDLRYLLETNVPESTKKAKTVLGVGDRKLADSISEEMHLSCQHTGVVPEILRGIRVHFHVLVRGLTEQSAGKAQLGLGHSYSRAKVKFNVNRIDNMIIQSISLMDQLDKDINTFSMRIREWYSYHFPELVKIVPDNYNYARMVRLIKNRKELSPDMHDQMEEIVMDSAKVKAIYDASRQSMGMDISPIDMINIEVFSTRIIALADYRKGLHGYLKSKMDQVAPNMAALIGEQVGARLISQAGSLTNLAKYPASTVQVLGAEKALFRALKTKTNTPKYGLIFHSTFIGRAASANKGRISRYLANKCSIASRIDCFSDYPTRVYGDHLRQQVEDRLKFFETGDAPAKNVDVMKKAMIEANEVQEKVIRQEKKKKKKEKRKLNESVSAVDTTMDTTLDISGAPDTMEEDEPVKKKKKKSKKAKESENDLSVNTTMDTSHGASDEEDEPQTKKEKKKKSKKAKKSENDISVNTTMDTSHGASADDDDDEAPPVKKHKKKKTKHA